MGSNKKNEDLLKKELESSIVFCDKFTDEAKDLISRLLVVNPEERLRDFEEIKSSSFFLYVDNETQDELFDWEKVKNKKYNPSFVPQILCDTDTKYFSRYFTEQISKSIYKEEIKLDSESKRSENSISKTENKYDNFTYIDNDRILK